MSTVAITGKCQTCGKVFLLADEEVWEVPGKKCILCEVPTNHLGQIDDADLAQYEHLWFPRLMKQRGAETSLDHSRRIRAKTATTQKLGVQNRDSMAVIDSSTTRYEKD